MGCIVKSDINIPVEPWRTYRHAYLHLPWKDSSKLWELQLFILYSYSSNSRRYTRDMHLALVSGKHLCLREVNIPPRGSRSLHGRLYTTDQTW